MRYAKQLEKERRKTKSRIIHQKWLVEMKQTTIGHCLKAKHKRVTVSLSHERILELLALSRLELADLQQELKILEQVYK